MLTHFWNQEMAYFNTDVFPAGAAPAEAQGRVRGHSADCAPWTKGVPELLPSRPLPQPFCASAENC